MSSTPTCRVCATLKAKHLINIFGPDGAKYEVINKIHAYLPIEVTETDLLPLTICLPCVCKLESYHIFKSKCYEAAGILKSLYQRNRGKKGLCRLCAEVSFSRLIDLFSEEALELDILKKIDTHLSIEITETDTLSHKICQICLEKLLTYHNFMQTCVNAHFALTAKLGLPEDKNEDLPENIATEIHCVVPENNKKAEIIPKITEVKSISSVEYNIKANSNVTLVNIQNPPPLQLIQAKTSNVTSVTNLNPTVNLGKRVVIGDNLKPAENISQNTAPTLVNQPQYILVGGKLVQLKISMPQPGQVAKTINVKTVNVLNEPNCVIPVIQPNVPKTVNVKTVNVLNEPNCVIPVIQPNVPKTVNVKTVNVLNEPNCVIPVIQPNVPKTVNVKTVNVLNEPNCVIPVIQPNVPKTVNVKTVNVLNEPNCVIPVIQPNVPKTKCLPNIISKNSTAVQSSKIILKPTETLSHMTSANITRNINSAGNPQSRRGVEIVIRNPSEHVVGGSKSNSGSTSFNVVTNHLPQASSTQERIANAGKPIVQNTSKQTIVERVHSKNTSNNLGGYRTVEDTRGTKTVTEIIDPTTSVSQETVSVNNAQQKNLPENPDLMSLIDSYNDTVESGEASQLSNTVETDLIDVENLNLSISDQIEVKEERDPLEITENDKQVSTSPQKKHETKSVTKTTAPLANTEPKSVFGKNNSENETLMENMDLITLLESDNTVLEFTDELQVSEQTNVSDGESNISVQTNKTSSTPLQNEPETDTSTCNSESSALSNSVSVKNNPQQKKVTKNSDSARVKDIIDLTDDDLNEYTGNGEKENVQRVDGNVQPERQLQNISNLPVKWNMLQNSLAGSKEIDNKKYKVIMVKPGDKSKKLTYKDVMNIVKRDHDLLARRKRRSQITKYSECAKEYDVPPDDNCSDDVPADNNCSDSRSSSKGKNTKEVTTNPFYRCVYCEETLMGNEKLLAHQTSVHKDKVFVCTLCEPNLVFYESKHFFAQHMSSKHPESRNNDKEVNKQPSGGNVTAQPKHNTVYIPNSLSISNTEKSSQSNKTITTSDAHLDGQANEMSEIADKSLSKKDGKTVFNIDVPEKSAENKKLSLKVSKHFNNMKRDVQSKIIQTLTEIMNKSTECSDKESEMETARDDDCEPMDNDSIEPADNNDNTENQETNKNDGHTINGMKVVFPDGIKNPLQNKRFVNKILKLAPHTCTLCGKTFRYPSAFSNHKNQCTGIIEYLCQSCGKIFKKKRHFDKHIARHTMPKPPKPSKPTEYVCETCGKIFDSQRRFHSHKQWHKKLTTQYTCDQCGRTFRNKESLTYHSPCYSGEEFLCYICGKSVKYQDSLKKHLRTHTEGVLPKTHVCETCGKAFRSRLHLKEHIYVHTGERPYQCEICSRTFRKLTSLRGHKTVHSNILKHKCKICGRCFRRQSYLIGHMKLHRRAGAKVNVCHVCKEHFETAELLAAHFLTHSAEEIEQLKYDKEQDPHICRICGDEVYGRAELRSHLQTHDIKSLKNYSDNVDNGKGKRKRSVGPGGFPCDICGKVFTSRHHHECHYRTHTGEKPFQCSYCLRKFTTQVLMKVHMRLHTGERPYKCKFCDRAFHSKSSIVQHELVHSDERPFSCKTCGKAFKKLDALNCHTRIHTGERPYSCRECGQTFTQGGDWRRHERRHLEGTIKTTSKPKRHIIPQKRLRIIYDSSGSGANDDSSNENSSHKSVEVYQQTIIQQQPVVQQHSVVQQQPPICHLPCVHCNKQFKSLELFNEHISSVHGYAPSYTVNIVKNADYLTQSVREIILGSSHIQ